MRQKMFKVLGLLLAMACAFSGIGFAGGLSTTFIEVRLKGVKPGETCSLEKKTGRLLVVTNTTESMTVDIAVDAEKPVAQNLVKGYEPIPDLKWVVIKKAYFKKVKPGKSATTDIVITVPKDAQYRGKRYQVYIYSHTAGSETFRMGLMSRILLEIEAAQPSKQSAQT